MRAVFIFVLVGAQGKLLKANEAVYGKEMHKLKKKKSPCRFLTSTLVFPLTLWSISSAPKS